MGRTACAIPSRGPSAAQGGAARVGRASARSGARAAALPPPCGSWVAQDVRSHDNQVMDRYERILTLHRLLKGARYPVTLQKLMEELQCSRATVYRDVAFLRDGLGAPLDTSEDPPGFHYAADEADRFELPGLW